MSAWHCWLKCYNKSMTSDRHSIIPAVWMIIHNDKNQVFLLRRFNTGWRDGWWTAPAGHVDAGESPIMAAIRELKEEAGVTVTADQLGEPLIYFYPADDMTSERVSLFFDVKTFEGEPTNIEPHKADRGEWFDLDNLPDQIVPILRQALIDLPAGVKYSERYYDPAKHSELLQ